MTIEPNEYEAALIRKAQLVDKVHVTLEADGFIVESPNRTINVKIERKLTSESMSMALFFLRRWALEAA